MAGNSEEYQRQLEMGHNAAWDQNWPAAIAAYTAALQARPDDAEIHLHLGLALLNAGQYERALKVYNRAHQLSPDDPIPLEKSADVLERMGRLREAAQQYVKVSDVYLAQRDLNKAIGNWERATQLTPGLVAIHAKLAQAYERVGDSRKAIREYLTLAFNFRRIDEVDKAIKAVERALRLDKNNPQALNTLRALKAGGEISMPEDIDEPTEAAPPPKQEPSLFDLPSEEERKEVAESHPEGPLGESMNEALMMLAAFVVESGALDAAGGDALQAMEMQRQGIDEEAIAAYKRSESGGMRHPALELSLGGLLLRAGEVEDAAKHLSEALVNPKLSPGAMHGLGQAYFKLGDHKKASRFLVQSLQGVDTQGAMSGEERDELQSTYDRLLTALEGRPAEALAQVNERFIGLMSGNDWRQRISDTRRSIEDISRDENEQGLLDFVVDASSESLAESLTRIDRYIRQGLYTLAMDECHRAVETSPYYLPVHVRMAEIMMNEGRVRQAINKYNTIARSYLVRGENSRAASILTEVLEMAPLDIEVRQGLIELLEGEERWSEVLEQYIGLAGTYQQLGNFDRSRETYEAAERLARRNEAPKEKIIAIKHLVADIDHIRLDTRKAQKVYEAILEIDGEDEEALKSLVDLYFGQGNQVEAIRKLDVLLGVYAKTGEIKKITQILEDMVKHYPNDTGVRSRLARIYKRLGRKREAIEQLDALGELQLEAGLHKDAANTIRQIIALKPEQVEDYQKLLSELGG